MNGGQTALRIIRKLDYTRCPWCGARYDEEPEHPHEFVKGNFLGAYGEFCWNCGKWARYHIFSMGLLVLFVLVPTLLSLPIPRAVAFWSAVIVSIPFFHRTLYYREPDYGKYLTPDERKLCTARFRWYSVKEGGIGLLRLRIYNHIIFPICFVDRHDRPITHTGCVRLCKKYFFLFQGAKLRLITDAIDAKKVGEGMRFYIFNQGERIGEGVVEKYLYRPLDGE